MRSPSAGSHRTARSSPWRGSRPRRRLPPIPREPLPWGGGWYGPWGRPLEQADGAVPGVRRLGGAGLSVVLWLRRIAGEPPGPLPGLHGGAHGAVRGVPRHRPALPGRGLTRLGPDHLDDLAALLDVGDMGEPGETRDHEVQTIPRSRAPALGDGSKALDVIARHRRHVPAGRTHGQPLPRAGVPLPDSSRSSRVETPFDASR